jgi:hypothetical protein
MNAAHWRLTVIVSLFVDMANSRSIQFNCHQWKITLTGANSLPFNGRISTCRIALP